MESNGLVHKIQISQSTADCLIERKKGHWMTPRAEKVSAKGKGLMQTYWAEPGLGGNKSMDSSGHSNGDMTTDLIDSKTRRLVDWNVDVLSKTLAKVIASRNARRRRNQGQVKWTKGGSNVLKEVKEVIELPDFDGIQHVDDQNAKLDSHIKDQLKEYVTSIALTYHANAFHNFEHCSHVCMSVAKLLSRIIAPDQLYNEETSDMKAKDLHDHTYGITSDPLTQFSCIFSALIHDADHPGKNSSVVI